MKLNMIVASLVDERLNKRIEFNDGVNFLIYHNNAEKCLFQKSFELIFEDDYYCDDFYSDNAIYVDAKLTDGSIDYMLKYTPILLEDDEYYTYEQLFIEHKEVVSYREITKNIINGYLKKNGDDRILTLDGDFNFFNDDKIEYFLARELGQGCRTSLSEILSILDEVIKDMGVQYVNKDRSCSVSLINNGKIHIEGSDEDNDALTALVDFYRFMIVSHFANEYAIRNNESCDYPLYISGLFELAGEEVDFDSIIDILNKYKGQSIIMCPPIMEEQLIADTDRYTICNVVDYENKTYFTEVPEEEQRDLPF